MSIRGNRERPRKPRIRTLARRHPPKRCLFSDFLPDDRAHISSWLCEVNWNDMRFAGITAVVLRFVVRAGIGSEGCKLQKAWECAYASRGIIDDWRKSCCVNPPRTALCAVLQVGRKSPPIWPIHPYICRPLAREFQCIAAGFSASVLQSVLHSAQWRALHRPHLLRLVCSAVFVRIAKRCARCCCTYRQQFVRAGVVVDNSLLQLLAQ